jgi:hypothetical protein
LNTDQNGVARLAVKNITFTSEERLIVLTTYRVYPVLIATSVEAAGYEDSGSIQLYNPPYRDAVTYLGQRQAILVVPISLKKASP